MVSVITHNVFDRNKKEKRKKWQISKKNKNDDSQKWKKKKKKGKNEKWTVWSRKWTSGIFIADSLLDLWYIQGQVLQQFQIMILLVQQWFY